MHTPTPRLLAILELLQSHGRMSGRDLAERLAVDRRTIRRDVLRLEDLGIPVATERGVDGGYRLVAGYKLPPMLFTEAEAIALSLGLLAARQLGLADSASAVASAQSKLERVFPADLKVRNRALASMVALAWSQRVVPLANNAWLLALSAAAHHRQRVELRYQAEGKALTKRAFDCFGLAHWEGRWYALGFCHLRGDVRSFRLDRVQAVKPMDASFTPPEDFDATDRLIQGIAALPRGTKVEVLLRTNLESARAALPDGIGLMTPWEGGVLLHGETGDLAWYARKLAGLPFEVDILHPSALQEALHAWAMKLLGRNSPGIGAAKTCL